MTAEGTVDEVVQWVTQQLDLPDEDYDSDSDLDFCSDCNSDLG